jgi:hypothetical protein
VRRAFEDIMAESLVAGQGLGAADALAQLDARLGRAQDAGAVPNAVAGPSVVWARDAAEREPARAWVQQLRRMLRAAWDIGQRLEEGKGCLVHCSDGWDRTPQLCSLAQLMSDPHYRTFEGFQTLVEKDWCGFGHKFRTRCAYAPDRMASQGAFSLRGDAAPVFLQWLDAVWQLTDKHPTAFAFNEALLLALAEHAYSGYFGTFEGNNERERRDGPPGSLGDFVPVPQRSVSVWAYVNDPANRFLFLNPLYDLHVGSMVQERWQVVFEGRVRVRAGPSDAAEALGFKTFGDVVVAAERRGIWIRLDEGDKGRAERAMSRSAPPRGGWMRVAEPGEERLLARHTVRLRPRLDDLEVWRGLFLRHHPIARQCHPLAKRLRLAPNRHRLQHIDVREDGVYLPGADRAWTGLDDVSRDCEAALGCDPTGGYA